MNRPILADRNRRADSRLTGGDQRYQIIFDAVNDGIFISDPASGRFIEVNEPGCRMFGYQRAELIGSDIARLSSGVHPYTQECAIEYLQKARLAGLQTFEWRGKTKTGVLFWVEISLCFTEFGKIPAVVAVVRDIDERKRATEGLHEAQTALIEAQAVAHIGSFAVDLLNNHTTWSDEYYRILGVDPATFVASFEAYLARIHPDDRNALTAAYKQSLGERAPRVLEQRIILDDGSIRIVQQRWQNYYGADGKPLRTIGTVHDITELRGAQNAISGNAVLHAVIASIAAIINNPTLDAGAPKALRMVGEALKVDRCVVVENVDRPGFPPNMIPTYQWNSSGLEPLLPPFIAELINQPEVLSWLRPLSDGKPVITTLVNANAAVKDILHALQSTSIVLIPIMVAGKNWGHIGLNDGTSQREWTAAEIEPLLALATLFGVTIERGRQIDVIGHMARYDFLTGLPNRASFIEELVRVIAAACREGNSFAVLYLDLDHFKDTNDTLGHPVGDGLLQAVAERLQAAIRKTDTVARFGGDEFALIETDIGEPADTVALADKILKTLSEPFSILGSEIHSGASIGIAIYGSDTPDPETLLSQADVALYRAKAEGRGIYRFFTDAMDMEVRSRVRITSELREAITSGQLFLTYQPQINIDTGHIIGLEALVRWHHPMRGIVPPDEFIPIAEKSGLIVSLGRWVLHEACRQMKEWLDADIAPPLIAVNVSALQFKTPFALENDISEILAETDLPPRLLELELTETAFMEVSREHSEAIQRLRKTGLRIAIDDFGTGYSSLEYLGQLPVNRIKIAQSFILNLTSKSRNRTIVKASIGMAHELGLDVIIEGVETAEQLELIRLWGGHKVQGFYFSKPLPAGELTALLRTGKIAPTPFATEAAAE